MLSIKNKCCEVMKSMIYTCGFLYNLYYFSVAYVFYLVLIYDTQNAFLQRERRELKRNAIVTMHFLVYESFFIFYIVTETFIFCVAHNKQR